MITRSELTNVLYLSCVENYFLAWLRHFYDVTKLYCDSFAQIGQIFKDFSCGATYENYNHVPRLQDIAEEYGVVRHEYFSCSARTAFRILQEQPPSALGLMRVNANFFEKFKRSSWREDHYVCVDAKMHWVNQYPLSEGNFDFEQFCHVYGGALILYMAGNLNVSPPDRMSDEIIQQRRFKIAFPKSLSDIEGAIGVLRITRKRMHEYYAKRDQVAIILEKETKLLDELYFQLRLCQIKGRNESDVFVRRQRVMATVKGPLEKVLAAEEKIAEVMRSGT